jgi:hypothetical protein
MLDVFESAQRLIKVVTGEPYGDHEMVMDIGVGTQRDEKKVWVTGDWNGTMGGRLFRALDRIGVEAEWYDQYDPCSDCQKLLETSANSYMWQPSYLRDQEGQIVCFDCIDVDDDSVLEEFDYINNPDKCIPDELAKHLPEWGWQPYNGTYENGWHPGQTDKPGLILEKIQGTRFKDRRSVVFRLDETSQFYIRFTAWVKDRRYEIEKPKGLQHP